jgi:UDP-glucose 4-epimerase
VMLDPSGAPVLRNFVHVDDLVSAILAALVHPGARQQTFNVCMDEPVDYGKLGAYLERTRRMLPIPIQTPYQSTWLDNTKAKQLLGWRPQYDLAKLTDAAFDYQRPASDPRKIWYPG